MPALQRAKPAKTGAGDVKFTTVTLPRQLRETKIVRDLPPGEVARDIVDWITKG